MLFWAALALVCFSSATAGSICPPRRMIYPCSCANVRHSKSRQSTIITCMGFDQSSLDSIFPVLRTLDIDQFHLYDSFWKNEGGGNLTTDWLTLMRVKEMTIEDSNLASCFVCVKSSCTNTVTTKFALSNSSSSEKLCNQCAKENFGQPWTTCFKSLKEFHLTTGNLTSFGNDFFPVAMRNLEVLNLANNKIAKVDSNVFKNLPSLRSLDLSHNAIMYFDHIFSNETQLQFLNLGFNLIRTFDFKFFQFLPKLKAIQLDSNGIVELKKKDGIKLPEKLRNIDLTDNPVDCNCSLLFINSTLPVYLHIGGTCATPDEYRQSAIRAASRLLMERCDEKGLITRRRPKKEKRN